MAVLGGLVAIPGQVFQGLLPPLVDSVAVAFIWLWFINLFNFMDGIDGIAGVQATGIGVGVAVVASAALAPVHMIFGMVAAASALGFLLWNWHPAKLFMGDVGSVGFGYLLGWLLLVLAANGQWTAAVILPMYFVADATITLVRRALARETLWHAHRDHFYQRAAVAVGNHSTVTRAVLMAQVGLVALAGIVALAPGVEASGILTAAVLVAALLWYLRRLAAR
jgi:UDP-N-acetylmuramyl pentapeptide phosphotransferase/UDP-N-acetylglucosamine-1-phosphate transferase